MNAIGGIFMKNCKRVLTFILALTATCINVPSVNSGLSGVIAYADEALQNTVSVTTQPKDYTGNGNEKNTWTVGSSTSDVTYQWQYQESGKTTWSNFKGANGTSLVSVK